MHATNWMTTGLLSLAMLACGPRDEETSSGAGGAGGPEPADGGGGATGGGGAAPLVWGACDTSSWPDGFPLPADGTECTTVDVPADPANRDAGATVPLRVARQRSASYPTGKAVFQLAGGPGGTSVGQTGVMPYVLGDLRSDFDLVYVDQRGTGGSGYLSCPGGYPETEEEWIACGQAHAAEDLSHVRTLDAAHDLEAVRVALGYEGIYLRGGSYGTRLGLEYLRQHGEHVVAAVLDGLVPPDGDFFGWLMQSFDRGVEMLASDCAASPECHALVPDVRAELAERRAALAASPHPIVVGGQTDVEDETLFLQALEASLYDPSLYYRLPHAVHAALAGDPSKWNAVLSLLLGLPVTEPSPGAPPPPNAAPHRLPHRLPMRGVDYVSPAVYETIVCAEDLPSSDGIAALEAAAAAQVWPDTSGLDIARGCSGWRAPPIDASLRAPVTSSARVLLLSGAIDLNTPTAWGVHAAETLDHGTHLVIPRSTHSTIVVSPCAATIAVQFLQADGDISEVDTACIDEIPAPSW